MGKVYGYCRISTAKQNIQRQIDNIKKDYENAIIITEEYTGTKISRPAFDKLLKGLKDGDTIVFDEVSRMSRNAEEGYKLYEQLYNQGINLIFIKEPHINTSTYNQALQIDLPMTGTEADYVIDGLKKMLMALAKKQIELAFNSAQAEVDFLHKRTSEGVRKANERYDRETALGIPHKKNKSGISKGTKLTTKKSMEMKNKILALSKDFNGTNNDIEVMAITKLARNTYYKYKRELKNNAPLQ